jgi:SAM-dependent methyltransferase
MTGAAGPRRPLVFTGRYRVAGPPGAELVDDWQATPRRLLPLLNVASRLVLLDPLSFPFEVLRPVDRDVPVAVALPPAPVDELEALLGESLLDHLGPGDRAAASDEMWAALADRRRWPAEMRLGAGPGDPEAVAAEALRSGATGERVAKEEGRRRAEALAHLLRGPYGPPGGARRLLDVGGRAEPWRHLLPGGVQFLAVPPAPPLAFSDEAVEGAVAVGVFGGLSEDERRALVSEMWRVLRPGGLLGVVDDVVPIPGSGRACPFARGALPRLLLGAGGRPGLSRVWSIRFPGEALHRGAGMSVLKAGETCR